MFKFNPKGFSLIIASMCFVLTIFHVGCKESSKGDSRSSINPGTDPKRNPEVDLTIITAQEVNDENIENFKVSGACVEDTEGGGDVTLTVGSRRMNSPCAKGIYTFVIDLTQLGRLSNPVIIKISQRVNGTTYSESRQVPQGYRTDDPPPENPVVETSIELIYPETSPSYVTNPILKVNNRFYDQESSTGDAVQLYTDRRCTELSKIGGKITVPAPGQDSEPTEGTYAKIPLLDLTPGKYRFYEISENSYGDATWRTTCNIGSLEYDLLPSLGAPKSPWLLLTVDPFLIDKSLVKKPKIRVYGVTPGNVVSLHKSNHCNDTAIASMEVPADQSYVELAGDTDLAEGVYLFRAKTRNFYGWSRCSLTGTYYTVLTESDITVGLGSGLSAQDTDLTPTIEVSNAQAGDTIHLYKEDCLTSLGSGTVADDGNSVDITINQGVFTTPGEHTIYGKITERKDSTFEYACTRQGVDYEIVRPNIPTMELKPGIPATDRTPTIVMSGLEEGDVVRLYRDNTCSRSIGSGTVPTGQTNVEVTSSSLSYGTYEFRAKLIQREDALPSECTGDDNVLDHTIRR